MFNKHLMRSLMFVPGHNERLMQSAARSSADILLLDIEDSVQPVKNKQLARNKIIEMVKNGDYGSFYGIWSSIANRATVQQAGFILLEVLHGDSWYTLRANCAQALLKLMNEDEIRTVDISADRPDQDDFLQRIEMKLMELLAGE